MMGLHESGTVSERHAEARTDSRKITAGQLASRMRKAGYKVTAKEIADYAQEWHHAGWNPKGGMGKTYFFHADYSDYDRLMKLVEADRLERSKPRYAFRVKFQKDGRRYIPVASFREVPAGNKVTEKDELISERQYEALRQFDGETLESYESLRHFAERMNVSF